MYLVTISDSKQYVKIVNSGFLDLDPAVAGSIAPIITYQVVVYVCT